MVTDPGSDERLCGLIILAPREPDEETFVKDAFRLLRAAGPALERSRRARRGGTPDRVAARWDVRPDRARAGNRARQPAAWREWPRQPATNGAECIARPWISPRPSIRRRTPRDLIVNELLKRGPAEVGLTRKVAAVVELEPVVNRPDWPSAGRVRIERGDLVVISGGARGITAEVAVALAESFGPRLVVARSNARPRPPSPTGWPEIHDEAELKRALLERSDGRRSLQELGEEARRLLAQREIRRQPRAHRTTPARRSSIARSTCATKRRQGDSEHEIRAEYGDGPWPDPRRRRPGRPQDRRSDRRPVRPGLRHEGQGTPSSLSRRSIPNRCGF